jgi:crotonobetainyl-CoA:carnitine CoA-transferase CaiB-like acyl-CoA transferase
MLDAVLQFLWPEGMAQHTFLPAEDSTDSDGSSGSGGSGGSGNRAAATAASAAVASRRKADKSYYTPLRDMVYQTADGYITVGTISMREWAGLCAALGRADWLADPRFQSAAGLARSREERLGMIAQELKSRGSAATLALLDEHDVPSAPIHHPRERILEDPQLAVNGSILRARHPHAGPMQFARPAARFSRGGGEGGGEGGSDAAATPPPQQEVPFELRFHAPLIGEHTELLLREVGVGEEELASLVRDKVTREPGMK